MLRPKYIAYWFRQNAQRAALRAAGQATSGKRIAVTKSNANAEIEIYDELQLPNRKYVAVDVAAAKQYCRLKTYNTSPTGV